MRIGLKKSPHIEVIVEGINKIGGVTWTSYNDTGADAYLCWGWPQAQQVERELGVYTVRRGPIICVDCHPFALQAGVTTGSRILQLDNFGALSDYAPHNGKPTPKCAPNRHDPDGHILVVGQVYTAEQMRLGLVDVWNTPGYDKWVAQQLKNPKAVFRPHPRVWSITNDGEVQPTLAQDLEGCSEVRTWNSTVGVQAKILGYPNVTAAEPHGWAHMDIDELAGQEWTPAELRDGTAWKHLREHLKH